MVNYGKISYQGYSMANKQMPVRKLWNKISLTRLLLSKQNKKIILNKSLTKLFTHKQSRTHTYIYTHTITKRLQSNINQTEQMSEIIRNKFEYSLKITKSEFFLSKLSE